MPGQAIPELSPIGDTFKGVVCEVDGKQALASSEQPGTQTLVSGSLIVRYGLRYLGKPFISVVPGLVALDYGDFLTGEEAWEFLLKGSNLYPRSEVIGYRNDGRDEMIVIKSLDISLTPEVLVYADAAATTPVARPTALITSDEAAVAARLLEFLPRFASLTEWQSAL